jgi:hypothetical protein
VRTTRRRTLAVAVPALAGLVLAVALWAAPVRAERPAAMTGLQLSTDGSDWGTSLTDPLFDPDHRLSPGDTATRVLYVRNDGAADSRAQVTLGIHDDRTVDGATWAVVAARTDSGRWTYLRDPDSVLVLRDLRLAPGDVRRVEVQATVNALAADAAMGRELQVDLDVRPLGASHDMVSAAATWWSPSGLARLVAATLGGAVALSALALARGRRREALP